MLLFLTHVGEGDEKVLGPVAVNFSKVQKFLPFGKSTLIFFDSSSTILVKESFSYIKEKLRYENI